MDNYEQKISHLKALYYLANVNGEFTEAQAIFIKNVAKRIGLSSDELEKFDGKEPKLDLPDKEYKIYALFHRLAIILMIGNKVDKIERNYCFQLGIRMGLHPNAVNEVIDYVVEHKTPATPPKEIINIFRKYQN